MSAQRKFDHRQLNSLVDRFGGWNKLMSAEYEPTEEIFFEFEKAGIGRAEFRGLRKTAMLEPREKAVKALAATFYCLITKRQAAKSRRPAWIMRSTENQLAKIWSNEGLKMRDKMREFDISISEVAQEILGHPNSYPGASPAMWDDLDAEQKI
jgi:hypothetical protein